MAIPGLHMFGSYLVTIVDHSSPLRYHYLMALMHNSFSHSFFLALHCPNSNIPFPQILSTVLFRSDLSVFRTISELN